MQDLVPYKIASSTKFRMNSAVETQRMGWTSLALPVETLTMQ